MTFTVAHIPFVPHGVSVQLSFTCETQTFQVRVTYIKKKTNKYTFKRKKI